MRIGILGPIDTSVIASRLDDPAGLPAGAGAPSVSLLVDGLVAAGHEVDVWTLSTDVDEPVRATGPGLRVWYGREPARGRGRTFHREERAALRDAMADARVDVLNAHWTYQYAWVGLARPEPLLVSARDWPPAILRYQFSPYRVVRAIEAARVVLGRPPMAAPSPYLARRYRALGLDVAVIPNGIADAHVVDAPRRRGDGMRVLVVANGFDDRKNTTSLLQAISRLRRRGVPVELELVGAGHGPGEDCEAWARDAGLLDGATFTGRVELDEVLAVMDRADLLVHPAREESYGRVLAEAMARGLPIVGGRHSGAVPWVLDGGTAGTLVDVDDPGAIGAAITDLLGDAGRWERCSAAGLAHVAATFTMGAIVQRYVAAYQAVIDGRPVRT